MSTLSVTTINTANSTTDLTLKTSSTSSPEIVLAANGSTLFNNVSTLSVGNTTINSTSFSIGNTSVDSESFYINGEDIVLKVYDSSNTQVFP